MTFNKHNALPSSDGRVLRPTIDPGRKLTPAEIQARAAELGLKSRHDELKKDI